MSLLSEFGDWHWTHWTFFVELMIPESIAVHAGTGSGMFCA